MKNQKIAGLNIRLNSKTGSMTSSETTQHCLRIYKTLQYWDLFLYKKKKEKTNEVEISFS